MWLQHLIMEGMVLSTCRGSTSSMLDFFSEHAACWLDMMDLGRLPFWLQGYADKQLKMHVDFLETELSEHGCCVGAWPVQGRRCL